MYAALHVKYPLFLSDTNQTSILSTKFRKASDIKFHRNLSSGSRVVPCGDTDWHTDAQRDMTKLTVAFRSFPNMPELMY